MARHWLKRLIKVLTSCSALSSAQVANNVQASIAYFEPLHSNVDEAWAGMLPWEGVSVFSSCCDLLLLLVIFLQKEVENAVRLFETWNIALLSTPEKMSTCSTLLYSTRPKSRFGSRSRHRSGKQNENPEMHKIPGATVVKSMLLYPDYPHVNTVKHKSALIQRIGFLTSS